MALKDGEFQQKLNSYMIQRLNNLEKKFGALENLTQDASQIKNEVSPLFEIKNTAVIKDMLEGRKTQVNFGASQQPIEQVPKLKIKRPETSTLVKSSSQINIIPKKAFFRVNTKTHDASFNQ